MLEKQQPTPQVAPRHLHKAPGATWDGSGVLQGGQDPQELGSRSLPGHQSPPAAGADPKAAAAPLLAPLQPPGKAQPQVAELSL